jgi:hypothetical protein
VTGHISLRDGPRFVVVIVLVKVVMMRDEVVIMSRDEYECQRSAEAEGGNGRGRSYA